MKKNFQLFIMPVITIIISVALGLISRDYFWGVITLIFGFLNAYYMAIGKWYNYIFGLLFSLSYAYVCGKNGLFGWVAFSFVLGYNNVNNGRGGKNMNEKRRKIIALVSAVFVLVLFISL